MSEQLPLRGFAEPAPVVVRPLALHRRARKMLRAWARSGQALAFEASRYLETLALLEDLRRQHRAALRDKKRQAREQGTTLRGGRAAAQFAASSEGRRLYRVIDEASERVQGWENALCG